MTVKKGEILNPKGRPKGAISKANAEIKEVINNMVNWINEPVRFKEIMLRVAANKTEVLVNFLAKIAPKDINLNLDEVKANPVLENMKKIRLELEKKNAKPKIIEVKG
mgnify:CR=1 FL=1